MHTTPVVEHHPMGSMPFAMGCTHAHVESASNHVFPTSQLTSGGCVLPLLLKLQAGL